MSNGKYHDSGKSIQSEVIYAGSTQPEADRGIGRTNRLTGGVHSPGIGVLLSNTVLGWYGLSRREILAKDSGAIFALIVSERVIASPALSGLLRETMRDEQARRAEMTKEGQRIDDPMRPQWSLEFFQHLSQTRREG